MEGVKNRLQAVEDDLDELLSAEVALLKPLEGDELGEANPAVEPQPRARRERFDAAASQNPLDRLFAHRFDDRLDLGIGADASANQGSEQASVLDDVIDEPFD